jgi:hypothetical protein
MMPIQMLDTELPETSKVAPRVTQDQIDQLHCSLRVLTHHFPGTTCTVAIAMLPDGFVAGVGHSACISITLTLMLANPPNGTPQCRPRKALGLEICAA